MKLKKTELFYFVQIILLTIYNSSRMTKLYTESFDVLLYVSVFFLIFKLILEKYSMKQVVLLFLAGVFGIYSMQRSDNGTLLICITAILGSKDIDIKRALKILFFTQCMMYAVVVFCAASGIIENVTIKTIRNGDTIIRYAWGFSHPNQMACSLILCFILFQYLYPISQKRFFCIAVFLDVMIYQITASRTGLLIFTVFILGKCLLNFRVVKKAVYIIALGCYPFMMFLSVFIPQHLALEWCKKVDILLQSRMTLSYHYLARFPIQLFGTKIDTSGMQRYHILDSGYVNVLLLFGIVIWIIFLLLNIYMVHMFYKQKRYQEMLIIVAVSLLGFTENVLYSLIYNFTLLWIGEVLLKEKRKENGKQISVGYCPDI